MVTETTLDSRQATDAELEAAKAEAEAVQAMQRIQHGAEIDRSLPGTVKPMTFTVPASDAASHVMVWELKVDNEGREYGIPRRAPRAQLGLWLQKRREFDGGQRFTADQPSRIAAEAQFKCLHQECRKRLYTRQDLVDHVENAHAREARLYRTLLDKIMQQAASDNPRVAELAETYASMSDGGVTSVAVTPEPREEELDLTAGKPIVTSIGGMPPREEAAEEIFRCQNVGCKRFFDTTQARTLHAKAQCKFRG